MKKHPDKDIRSAIEMAEQAGWHVLPAGKSSHCFCRLCCGDPAHPQHLISIWSTPRNPYRHAQQIRKLVIACQQSGDSLFD